MRLKTILSCFVSLIFFSQTVLTSPAKSAPAVLPLTQPVLAKGLIVHPNEPFLFDFVIDQGDFVETGLKPVSTDEAMKLIKYFLAALTIPEKDQWVNLSPAEPDRITTAEFGQTEMGRDLLQQDYVLKQLTASLMNPESQIGRKFWDKVYEKIYKEHNSPQPPLYIKRGRAQHGGVTDPVFDDLQQTVETFNKVWIMPDKAVVVEHGQGVFIKECRLKVMTEADYQKMSLREAEGDEAISEIASSRGKQSFPGIESPKSQSDFRGQKTLAMTQDLIREIILPEIERRVNEGEEFAPLRQIYHSMILAVWYKTRLKESLLGRSYIDHKITGGVEAGTDLTQEEIYQQYLELFRNGTGNIIREEYDPATQQIIPRHYFSGGVLGLDPTQLTVAPSSDWASLVGNHANVVRFRALPDSAMMSPYLDVEKMRAQLMRKFSNDPYIAGAEADIIIGMYEKHFGGEGRLPRRRERGSPGESDDGNSFPDGFAHTDENNNPLGGHSPDEAMLEVVSHGDPFVVLYHLLKNGDYTSIKALSQITPLVLRKFLTDDVARQAIQDFNDGQELEVVSAVTTLLKEAGWPEDEAAVISISRLPQNMVDLIQRFGGVNNFLDAEGMLLEGKDILKRALELYRRQDIPEPDPDDYAMMVRQILKRIEPFNDDGLITADIFKKGSLSDAFGLNDDRLTFLVKSEPWLAYGLLLSKFELNGTLAQWASSLGASERDALIREILPFYGYGSKDIQGLFSDFTDRPEIESFDERLFFNFKHSSLAALIKMLRLHRLGPGVTTIAAEKYVEDDWTMMNADAPGGITMDAEFLDIERTGQGASGLFDSAQMDAAQTFVIRSVNPQILFIRPVTAQLLQNLMQSGQ